jgi:hypothetical protein
MCQYISSGEDCPDYWYGVCVPGPIDCTLEVYGADKCFHDC